MNIHERAEWTRLRARQMLVERDPTLAESFTDREREVLALGIMLGATAAFEQVGAR